MKHVVMFSGGVGSWAAARRVADRFGTESLTLLFADTLIEDEDLYRFICDAAADIGAPLVRVADGRTPWQVYRDVRYIGNTRIAQCSHLLKQKPCRSWLDENCDPVATTIYVGIDWSESHRLPGIVKGWAPFTVEAPMCDAPYVDKPQMLAMLAKRGILPSRSYALGFSHDNCGGFCCRAGQGHFDRLRKTRPALYAHHEAEEQALIAYLGKDVSILRDRTGGTTKPLTLKDFRIRVEKGSQVDALDIGGCGCFSPQNKGEPHA